jgi:hypothetical protein
MNRYFKITCDEDGNAREETCVEIFAPQTFYGIALSVGILIGVIISIIIL